MGKKNVTILENNLHLANDLKLSLNLDECSNDIEVIFIDDDGEAGLENIKNYSPDLVVVSMFLKRIDGCNVIQEIRKFSKTIKIIATGASSDTLMERAMSLGADYYFIKPYSIDNIKERIIDLLDEKESTIVETIKKSPPKLKVGKSIDEEISEIFISIGIPPHIKGYKYLREGIKLTINDPFMINNVTKSLYPGIATEFDTSPSKVERAIRHAIEVAWNRGRLDAITSVFGNKIYLGSDKPTNSEFIALIADKLILQNTV